MIRKTQISRVRAGAFAAVALVAVMAAGCASVPPGSYPGGTYSVDVALPGQAISHQFGQCTASVTVPEIPIPGATVTVPAFSVAEGQTSITVPNVMVSIPGATLAGGTAELVCDGETVGSVPFSITFAGTVAASEGTLDTATKTITLSDATVDLSEAAVDVAGLPTFPLPTPTITLPEITVSY